MTAEETQGSFWDHLDILRSVILKIFAVWGILSIVAFFFKDEVFGFLLAPKEGGFILYEVLGDVCRHFGFESPSTVDVQLINTGLAQQFMIHIKTAMCVGLVFATPYALYQLFGFIAPALYTQERRYTSRVVVSGYLMFLLGIALSYLVIFPLTFQFLGSYQVSAEVVNLISLESYMGTLIMMCLCMGIVCELPVVTWLLAKLGIVNPGMLSSYRRHAVVVILIVAAIITPTSDVFTLLVVSLPIWLLYEISILLTQRITPSHP